MVILGAKLFFGVVKKEAAVVDIKGGLLVGAFVSRMSLKTAVVVGRKGRLVVGRLVWDRKGRKALVVVVVAVVVDRAVVDVVVLVVLGGFPTLTMCSFFSLAPLNRFLGTAGLGSNDWTLLLTGGGGLTLLLLTTEIGEVE